jgi:hypothetical protein
MVRPLDARAKVEYAILSALEYRIPGHGCERVIVVGYAQDEVDETMRELVAAGFVHALWIADPGHYVPSELTELGRARLKVLRLR